MSLSWSCDWTLKLFHCCRNVGSAHADESSHDERSMARRWCFGQQHMDEIRGGLVCWAASPERRQGCYREEERRHGALARWLARRIFLADLRGGAGDKGREDVVDCHVVIVVCADWLQRTIKTNDREGGRFSGSVFFVGDGFPQVQVKTKREGRGGVWCL